MSFHDEVSKRIESNFSNNKLKDATFNFLYHSIKQKYSYNFTWMGRPIIQYPQDVVAIQEIVWDIKPDLIIETGIAHGGSLILSATLLALIDYSEAVETNTNLNPLNSKRKVIGIDIDIREHNKLEINKHPMSHMIHMVEGSSIDNSVINKVHSLSKDYKRIIVLLDSNHTHDHVKKELDAYATLVTPGSYCVVFDTVIEDLPDNLFNDRTWSRGNNPKTAVRDFIKNHNEFVIDKNIVSKIQITVAPDGYLKRIE